MIGTSHFQGGTITYKILNTYGSTVSIMITQTYLYRWPLIYCDNSYILSQSSPNISTFSDYNAKLNCLANCTTTGGYTPIPVRGYCTDYSAAMSISSTQRTDIVNLTIGAYFEVGFVSSAWRTLNLPTTGPASKGWSVSNIIDLRLRSDTGKPNTPPVATMISPISIPVGVPQTLVIPTIDGDNDVVRCRFANGTKECADVCPPSSLPNNTILISSNCTLLITGAQVNDWYAVALQIEDFANSNSTSPLSSVPVQFLVHVYATQNCTIHPFLYGLNNQIGACENVQVGNSHSMILYAENYCSSYGITIDDIATLSFPIVIKSSLFQNTSTLYSVSLTWTPTASQVGSQILCAVAIDSQSVQSNQYCVAFVVSNNGTGTCPGTVSETTVLVYSTNEQQTTASDVSSITTTTTTTTSTTSTIINTTTTVTTTTTTTTDTTTVSTSDSNPWLIPLIVTLASLMLLACCLYFCCLSPCGFGLLSKRRQHNVSSELLHSTNVPSSSAQMYMIHRSFENDLDHSTQLSDSLNSARTVHESGIQLHIILPSRNNTNNNRKDSARWVYPSPRSYQIAISRAIHND